MTTGNTATLGFMVCVNNAGYPASLEVGKSYEVLPDESAEPNEIRVVDESGEDYLYPAEYFSQTGPSLPAVDLRESLQTDVEREAQAFMAENAPLLEDGGASALGRVFVQGANISTALSQEAVEAANHAERVTRALAEAIRNPATPATRIHELETERPRARAIYEHRNKAFEEFVEFLDAVSEAREQRAGEPE